MIYVIMKKCAHQVINSMALLKIMDLVHVVWLKHDNQLSKMIL